LNYCKFFYIVEETFKINENDALEVFMNKAQNGDTVKIHYTGKLANGKVFYNSRAQKPLEFKVGDGKITPVIEKSVIGMETGDTKTIEIPPEEAYGPRQNELVVELEKSQLPDNITAAKGNKLKLKQPDGDSIDAVIIDENEETVTLDANHPLAGHTLFFNLELVDIA
jgi:FKBP-type peptidyl-prolyl cis-trans isomerase 2